METVDKSVKCVVVTPERTVVDTAADFVAIPLYDGELGVLAGRAPLIARLGPGELRTVRGQEVKRFFVDGGFAQVRNNVVTVLTPRAIRAEDIKIQAVQQEAQGLPLTEAQAKAQQKARVQLRIAQHR